MRLHRTVPQCVRGTGAFTGRNCSKTQRCIPYCILWSDDEKFYFEAGDDMGYFEDTGNFDARTEGMSYAMMMCVQMDMKNEFDRVWKWARTYMYMEDGYNKGYFAWSCKTTVKRMI